MHGQPGLLRGPPGLQYKAGSGKRKAESEKGENARSEKCERLAVARSTTLKRSELDGCRCYNECGSLLLLYL